MGVGATLGVVGEIQERSDVRQFEAQRAGVSDEGKAAHILV